MSRRMNIYYNAVFGAAGGLIGWLLLGLVPTVDGWNVWLRAVIQGGALGCCIGTLVSLVEPLLDRAPGQIQRDVARGAIASAVGGAAGLLIGELALRAGQASGVGHADLVSRAVGWAVFGLLVGIGEGWAHHSSAKTSYGAVGGTIGGFVGGAAFAVVAEQSFTAQGVSRGLGLVLLGACIGSIVQLAEDVRVRARLRVLTGKLEGREFNLRDAVTLIGASDECAVRLPGDEAIPRRAAEVRRTGGGNRATFELVSIAPGNRHITVNRVGAHAPWKLQDGDVIQIGATRMRFGLRVRGVNRAGPMTASATM